MRIVTLLSQKSGAGKTTLSINLAIAGALNGNSVVIIKGREDMVRAVVDHGLTQADAARRFNTTAKTVAKLVRRFGEHGLKGLADRSGVGRGWTASLNSTARAP